MEYVYTLKSVWRVDEVDAVQCQCRGLGHVCGRVVYASVHFVVTPTGAIECWGCGCYARESEKLNLPKFNESSFPCINGRRLTDEERELLTSNRVALLARFAEQQAAVDKERAELLVAEQVAKQAQAKLDAEWHAKRQAAVKERLEWERDTAKRFAEYLAKHDARVEVRQGSEQSGLKPDAEEFAQQLAHPHRQHLPPAAKSPALPCAKCGRVTTDWWFKQGPLPTCRNCLAESRRRASAAFIKPLFNIHEP